MGTSMGGMIVQTVALNTPTEFVDDLDHVVTARRRLHGRHHGRRLREPAWPGAEGARPDGAQRHAARPPTRTHRTRRAAVASAGRHDGTVRRGRRARPRSGASSPGRRTSTPRTTTSSPWRCHRTAPTTSHAITTPTLVVHGTRDPILPYPHGEATANAIPGATLLADRGHGSRAAAAGDPDPRRRDPRPHGLTDRPLTLGAPRPGRRSEGGA